jgi:hypothetical protein
MLEYSDLRAKIPILFMASSGMRLGSFQGLTDGCIKPIHNENTNKLLAAHVVVYKGQRTNMILLLAQRLFMLRSIAIWDKYRLVFVLAAVIMMVGALVVLISEEIARRV